jgi:uncharacterized protein YecE (DUF72 family)
MASSRRAARSASIRSRAHPEVRIGCSGWQYASWRGTFYPEGLAQQRWLAYYTSVFDTVEVNNTFYRLPDARVFTKWLDATPGGFLFAVKASRFLTHMKRLRDPRAPLTRLFSRACALGSHLGPVLYQLPGNMKIDLDRLDTFLDALERSPDRACARRRKMPAVPALRHALEFRHPSWFVPEVYARLRQADVAFCIHDKAGAMTPREITASFVYVRFHGTSGHYRGGYGSGAIGDWAGWLADQWRQGRDVFAYFNNDPNATAVRNALALRQRVADLTAPAFGHGVAQATSGSRG